MGSPASSASSTSPRLSGKVIDKVARGAQEVAGRLILGAFYLRICCGERARCDSKSYFVRYLTVITKLELCYNGIAFTTRLAGTRPLASSSNAINHVSRYVSLPNAAEVRKEPMKQVSPSTRPLNEVHIYKSTTRWSNIGVECNMV